MFPVSDPLAALRRATAERHAALDAGLPIARAGATLLDYGRHLAATRDWLCATAPFRAQLAPDFPPDARRMERIRLDLMDCAALAPGSGLGMQPDAWGEADERAPARQAPWQPERVADAGFCWGVAYVVEGSALGGLALARLHGVRLAPHPLRYLAGDGAATGARWQSFLRALRAHVATPGLTAAACEGAAAAFDEFARRMPREVVA